MTEAITLQNGWSFNVQTDEEILPRQGILQAIELLDRWRTVFPLGDTWVGEEYGVPSLFVRLDCVYDHERGLKVFEVEERPCGIGTTLDLNPNFKELLNSVRQQWPHFQWVSDPDRVTDDDLWLGPPLSLEEALKSDGLLLVRSRPEKTEYHPLESRAVSSVSHEGDKHYGITLGLWQPLSWVSDLSSEEGGHIHPPVTDPVVVKPIQGTRCRGVGVHLNGSIVLKKIPGRGKVSHLGDVEIFKSNADTIGESMLIRHARSGNFIRQPFIMPLHRDFVPGKNVIYRFFLGYSPSSGKYVPLGGVWAAHNTLRVHGEEGVVFGPLNFED